jgi:hypothetical protein
MRNNTEKNNLQNAIITAEELQKRMKIAAPETARIATPILNWPFSSESNPVI